MSAEVTETRVRFVHVAVPGRPLSDEMDQRVLGDPRVRRALEGADFERVVAGRGVPRAVAEVLPGVGTVCLDAEGLPIAVRAGPSGVADLLAFVGAGARIAAARAVAHEDRLALARIDLRHGLVARARATLGDVPGESAALLRIEAALRDGDVEAARLGLAQVGAAPERAGLDAWLAVLDARAADALAWLDSATRAVDDGLQEYWRGRALLDLGRRIEAYAVLEALAERDDLEWGRAANELLAGMVRNVEGHAHVGGDRSAVEGR